MKESLKHLIQTVTVDTGAYMQTLQHKVITYAGGTSAIYQLRDTFSQWLPDPAVNLITDIFSFIAAFPMMNFLSGLAVFLLVVERFFIAVGKYRAWRRGE